MTSKNPFRPTRFEFEKRRALIVRTEASKTLESRDNFYVSGNRGSGKTLLFKSIEWRERRYNTSLKDQINEPDDFIAVYCRLPDHMGTAFGNVEWQKEFPKSAEPVIVEHYYFSLFFESLISQNICEAINEIRATGEVKYTFSQEKKFVHEFVEELSELVHFKNSSRGVNDIRGLQLALMNMSSEMANAAVRGMVSDIMPKLPKCSVGVLLRKLVSKATQILELENIYGKNFNFKICIDDCEFLTRNQQLSLNTLVRQTGGDVFWLIAYVGSSVDATETYLQNQSLTDADRKCIPIQDIEEGKFREFCEAVAGMRCTHFALEHGDARYQTSKEFQLKNIIGKPSINALIENAVKRSVSQASESIYEDAEKLVAAVKRLPDNNLAGAMGLESEILPFYQAYLMSRLNPGKNYKELLPTDLKKAKSFGANLRRKQLGAMLAMMNEIGIRRIPYAGQSAVMGMTDFCIRDFLEIMGAIYDEYMGEKIHPSSFVNILRPINIKRQSKAIREASKRKYLGINQKFEVFISETLGLIDGLGRLTARLQSNHKDIRTLHTTERGVFELDLSRLDLMDGQNNDQVEKALRVLRKSELMGILLPPKRNEKISSEDNKKWRFRLHARLAAHYGFSFRGAYEPVPLKIESLIQLVDNASKTPTELWVSEAEKFAINSQYEIQLDGKMHEQI